MKRIRCAVFISGRGSNLGVLLAASKNISVSLVLSNREDAFGLERAKQAGVPAEVLKNPTDWQQVQERLENENIEVVFLAGFLKVIPAKFVNAWRGRIFNIHPSLLPKYKGLDGIKRAFEKRDDIGASLHRVIPEVDGGEVLYQGTSVKSSEVSSIDLAEATARTHDVEHQLVRQWIEECPKLLMS